MANPNGALAGPVRTHQGMDLAPADFQRYALKYRFFGHVDVQIDDGQRFGHSVYSNRRVRETYRALFPRSAWERYLFIAFSPSGG